MKNSKLTKIYPILLLLLLQTQPAFSTNLNLYFDYQGTRKDLIVNSYVTQPFIPPKDKFTITRSNFIDMDEKLQARTLFFEASNEFECNITFYKQNKSLAPIAYKTKIPKGKSNFEVELKCPNVTDQSWTDISMELKYNSTGDNYNHNVTQKIFFRKICDKKLAKNFDISYILLGIIMFAFLVVQAQNYSGEELERHYFVGLNSFYLPIFFGSGAVSIFMGLCYSDSILSILCVSFGICAASAINLSFSRLLLKLYPTQRLRARVIGVFSKVDILCWMLVAILISGWAVFSDWVSHDIIVFSIAAVFMDIINLAKFKYIILFYLLLVCLNLLWVFQTLNSYGFVPMMALNTFSHVPSYLKIPRLLNFPGGDFIIFSFSDLIIMGLVLKFFRAFDQKLLEETGKEGSYGFYCSLLYSLGFLVYGCFLCLSISAWPLFLITVSLSFGCLLAYSAVRGEFRKVVKFPLEDDGNAEMQQVLGLGEEEAPIGNVNAAEIAGFGV
jgi:hypothetical protein